MMATRINLKLTLLLRGIYPEFLGLEFTKTFNRVIKPTMSHIILSFVHFEWHLKQLDVKNAFLYGFLHEQVLIKKPLDFINLQFPNHICFSLKQILCSLFEHLSLLVYNCLSRDFALKDLGNYHFFFLAWKFNSFVSTCFYLK